ncbi:MAG: hydroxymethylglutaryl-CoA lyase [Flavobacteriales bacterium]|nr:hydroxymethylglutaryl-CoA lyase [Flavobacteriales bacterium]
MKLIECPRDAMQGIVNFIPTELKIKYINQLLKVGFDTIDFGSFVSHRLVPQLKDTSEVLSSLDLSRTKSKLLSIVANVKGASEACFHNEIDYLGFPLSVSEEFQKRNTNKSIADALISIEKIQNLCIINNKEMVVYLSMAFGNPYGENYHPDMIASLTQNLSKLNIKTVALSDTIGVANNKNISQLFAILTNDFSDIEFGAHFHSKKYEWREKIESAYVNGCRRFDAALNGFGGCPMAKDDLVGNIATENLATYFKDEIEINLEEFAKSLELTSKVFN